MKTGCRDVALNTVSLGAETVNCFPLRAGDEDGVKLNW